MDLTTERPIAMGLVIRNFGFALGILVLMATVIVNINAVYPNENCNGGCGCMPMLPAPHHQPGSWTCPDPMQYMPALRLIEEYPLMVTVLLAGSIVIALLG
jgi:hypothetical protein